jgi:hypothetical protein
LMPANQMPSLVEDSFRLRKNACHNIRR